MAVVLRVKGYTIPITDVSVAAHAVEKGADLVPADCHCEAVNRIAWLRLDKGG
jgi:predicted nucleic acid-binding protein